MDENATFASVLFVVWFFVTIAAWGFGLEFGAAARFSCGVAAVVALFVVVPSIVDYCGPY